MIGEEPSARHAPRNRDDVDGSQAVDAQTRNMAQEAGLDRDLESQVPPLYGQFTTRVIASIAILAIVALLWILL
ncbi:MAG: hypothetical protein QE284_05510 [Rhizobium sp.]|nr:hypothetical protein [Rhizobium sp.]